MILEELRFDGDVAILLGRRAQSNSVLALALTEAGASLVVAGPVREEIESIVSEVRVSGGDAVAVKANLTSLVDLHLVREKALSRFGRIDILVNNSGILRAKPFLDMSEAEWTRAVGENLTTAFLACRVFGGHMYAQRSGRIVNIISGLSERGVPNGTAYCAAMGAVAQLTRSLALEWARDNVRINAIGTGWMEDENTPDDNDLVTRFIPAGRRGRGDDVAPLAILLASKASSYLTGYMYVVDGGLMARG
jgi:NAD(P)-dependent dehydrogenase (short-subunit alcohol dehydrogenase family)